MAEPSIAPCPFCGDDDTFLDAREGRYESPSSVFFVICSACGASGPEDDSAREATVPWNAAPRATPQPDSRADAAKEILRQLSGLSTSFLSSPNAIGAVEYLKDRARRFLEGRTDTDGGPTPQPEVPETLWGHAIGDRVQVCTDTERGTFALGVVTGVVTVLAFERCGDDGAVEAHMQVWSDAQGRSFTAFSPDEVRPAPRAEGAGDE